MRVISGIHKKMNLEGYNVEGIRPTMDKVKESIFAMIYEYIDNSIVLDLFSGTGSLGIEALSNGAKEVYFIDNSKLSLEITNKNIQKLKTNNKVVTILSDYKKALINLEKESKKFDIIFLDPPYGKIKIKEILKQINTLNILNDNGIIICEYEEEELSDNYDSLELIKDRKYGKTSVKIYKRR